MRTICGTSLALRVWRVLRLIPSPARVLRPFAPTATGAMLASGASIGLLGRLRRGGLAAVGACLARGAVGQRGGGGRRGRLAVKQEVLVVLAVRLHARLQRAGALRALLSEVAALRALAVHALAPSLATQGQARCTISHGNLKACLESPQLKTSIYHPRRHLEASSAASRHTAKKHSFLAQAEPKTQRKAGTLIK